VTFDAVASLLDPRDTLRVLEYVAGHPSASPDTAVVALGASHHTWYAALKRLEGLGFVIIERVPGGKKVRRIELTAEGREALLAVERLRGLAVGSPDALEAAVRSGQVARGSPQAGEVLLRLTELSERRGVLLQLGRIARLAEEARRPGEAAYARGVLHFTKGEMAKAGPLLEEAVAALEAESGGRSYRRALFFRAAVMGWDGRGRQAFVDLMRLRKMAKDAGDLGTEADAWMALGIMKSVREQLKDGCAHFEKALVAARRGKLPGKEAKVLMNLCLTEFLMDPTKGWQHSQEALALCRQLGARVLEVNVRNNRALMLAVAGKGKEALAELGEGRRLALQVGYERGPATRQAWERVVRRLVRMGGARPSYDWRSQIQRILAPPPDEPGTSVERRRG
jgi:DNA-binding MarR family transcriptional regulator